MFLVHVNVHVQLVMGNDIRHMDNFTIDLVTSKEVLAVNQDPQCIQVRRRKQRSLSPAC